MDKIKDSDSLDALLKLAGVSNDNNSDKNKKKKDNNNQIEIANKCNLPIVIHNRDAYVDTIQILKVKLI